MRTILGPCPCQGCGTLVYWTTERRWVHEAGVFCPGPASARMALNAALERQADIVERQPKAVVRPAPPLSWMRR